MYIILWSIVSFIPLIRCLVSMCVVSSECELLTCLGTVFVGFFEVWIIVEFLQRGPVFPFSKWLGELPSMAFTYQDVPRKLSVIWSFTNHRFCEFGPQYDTDFWHKFSGENFSSPRATLDHEISWWFYFSLLRNN